MPECTSQWLMLNQGSFIVLSESLLWGKPDKAHGKQLCTQFHLIFNELRLKTVDKNEWWFTSEVSAILNSVFTRTQEVFSVHKAIPLCCQSRVCRKRKKEVLSVYASLIKSFLFDSLKSISLCLACSLPLWQANQTNTILFNWLGDEMSFKATA